MEPLHREIVCLIIRRRSALTLQQMEKSVLGYRSHLIKNALNLMIIDGHLQFDLSHKDRVYYQLTLAGLNAYNEVAS
jgi:hypothetical protein